MVQYRVLLQADAAGDAGSRDQAPWMVAVAGWGQLPAQTTWVAGLRLCKEAGDKAGRRKLNSYDDGYRYVYLECTKKN